MYRNQTAAEVMAAKHQIQMNHHVNEYGPLGVLRRQPTQAELDKLFKEREKNGDLFTQRRGE